MSAQMDARMSKWIPEWAPELLENWKLTSNEGMNEAWVNVCINEWISNQMNLVISQKLSGWRN